MTTNVSLSKTPAIRGSLLCKSGPIYIVTFYLFSRRNLLINGGVGFNCLHTCIFIKTTSPEELPTKAKEDPSLHEVGLYLAGHHPVFPNNNNKIITIIIIIIIKMIIHCGTEIPSWHPLGDSHISWSGWGL